jgi:hypothetical protein
MRDSRCPAASILNDPPESDRSHPGPPSRFDESGNVDVGHLEQCGRFCRGIEESSSNSIARTGRTGRGFQIPISDVRPAQHRLCHSCGLAGSALPENGLPCDIAHDCSWAPL